MPLAEVNRSEQVTDAPPRQQYRTCMSPGHPHVSFGSLWKSLGSGYTRNSFCVTNIAARTSITKLGIPLAKTTKKFRTLATAAPQRCAFAVMKGPLNNLRCECNELRPKKAHHNHKRTQQRAWIFAGSCLVRCRSVWGVAHVVCVQSFHTSMRRIHTKNGVFA